MEGERATKAAKTRCPHISREINSLVARKHRRTLRRGSVEGCAAQWLPVTFEHAV
jgi:hypothetical protein